MERKENERKMKMKRDKATLRRGATRMSVRGRRTKRRDTSVEISFPDSFVRIFEYEANVRKNDFSFDKNDISHPKNTNRSHHFHFLRLLTF